MFQASHTAAKAARLRQKIVWKRTFFQLSTSAKTCAANKVDETMPDTRSLGALFADVPSLLLRYRLWVGIAAILLCAVTWAVDLLEIVYQCPFCRVQRTVIGLLGLLLMIPNPAHWFVRYLSAIFAVFGLSVAATQHFRGWARIMGGEFEWGDQWYLNSWLLSGFAIAIIVALLMLIWSPRKTD